VPVPLVEVDAFTSEPFRGNPAAVCVLSAARDPSWMQNVAREMNLSETAFVRPLDEGFELRWFTPAVEVDLCGHATLASAHALWEMGRVAAEHAMRFHTRSGVLGARRADGMIELDFPATLAQPVEPPAGLVEALGASPRYVGRNRFDFLLELDSEESVRRLAPDFPRLRGADARGVIVTSRSDTRDRDFVSRFFAPGSGIDEDPVTGSAHCCLAPFWAARLNKSELVGHQISARGGVVRMRLDGDRVLLGGQAVTVWRGELFV
jgi:PhzF family phenazine biosynthesis protein